VAVVVESKGELTPGEEEDENRKDDAFQESASFHKSTVSIEAGTAAPFPCS